MSETPTPTFQGEALLRRWSESSTQGVQVTFALADAGDLEPLKAKTGKRFACVLVEIGDDEQPVQGSFSNATLAKKERLGDLCYWSVMRCAEPTFWDFLGAQFPSADMVENKEEAALLLKYICQVDSRSEFDTDPAARERFNRLIRYPYQKWAIAKGIA